MRKPPVLNPCSNRWRDLEPRVNGRYCGECDKVVLDFTRLTRKQATQLVRNATERVCARIVVDEHGEPLHRIEPKRTANAAAALAAGSLLAAACSTTTANQQSTQAPTQSPSASVPAASTPTQAVSATPACNDPTEESDEARREAAQRLADEHQRDLQVQEEFMGEADNGQY